jgi:GNAT superfamily N-acetyltransferase
MPRPTPTAPPTLPDAIDFDPPLPAPAKNLELGKRPRATTAPTKPSPGKQSIPDAALADAAAAGFTQRLTIARDGRTIASARWHCRDTRDGIVQILELSVAADLRRQGLGRLLAKTAIDQARQFHADRNRPLRRAWLLARQKSDVIARAFLTSIGFHHVSSLSDFLAGEEGLIYTRSFD